MDGIEGLDKVSRVEHVSLEPPWRDALSLGAAGAQSAALVDLFCTRTDAALRDEEPFPSGCGGPPMWVGVVGPCY